MERRFAIPRDGNFQTRAEDGNLYIEGYNDVNNSRYNLWDGAYETIAPGAFDGETGGDIRALTNHDTTLVLGRTTAGTLTLRTDETGLWGSIIVNQADQDAMNLYERVKRGDVSQCSFGFDILEQDVQYQDGEPTVWIIRKVRLYEVSVDVPGRHRHLRGGPAGRVHRPDPQAERGLEIPDTSEITRRPLKGGRSRSIFYLKGE